MKVKWQKKKNGKLRCGICGRKPVYGKMQICKICADRMAKPILQMEEEAWLKMRRKRRQRK